MAWVVSLDQVALCPWDDGSTKLQDLPWGMERDENDISTSWSYFNTETFRRI